MNKILFRQQHSKRNAKKAKVQSLEMNYRESRVLGTKSKI